MKKHIHFNTYSVVFFAILLSVFFACSKTMDSANDSNKESEVKATTGGPGIVTCGDCSEDDWNNRPTACIGPDCSGQFCCRTNAGRPNENYECRKPLEHLPTGPFVFGGYDIPAPYTGFHVYSINRTFNGSTTNEIVNTLNPLGSGSVLLFQDNTPPQNWESIGIVYTLYLYDNLGNQIYTVDWTHTP